jgi:hypothetical protein
MVVVREKTTGTQRIHGNCPTHSRTEIAVPGQSSANPRSVKARTWARADRNDGGGIVRLHQRHQSQMREEHGIELKAMTIDAESTLDRRGTQLLEEIEVPFRPGKGEG